MKLNWVTIRVRDLEKSVKFYTEALGMEIAAQFGSPDHQIVMLGEKDQPKVELIFEPGKTYGNLGEGVSIGLEIDGLDELVGSLKAKGYPVAGPIAPNPSVRFFFVPDPNGYSIQLVEQK